MKYEDIKDFYERCDKHPDHQTGMISYLMVEQRLQEEIEELRQYIEQRKWVKLTDKEIEEIWDADTTPEDTTGSLYYAKLIIRKAESKLRMKNDE